MTQEATTPAPTKARENWRARAGCRDSSVEMVPGGEGDHSGGPTEIQQAKLVCRRCPVRGECLAEAAELGKPHGVWGGLTQAERIRLIAAEKLRHPSPVTDCTTCGLQCVPAARTEPRCDVCLRNESRRGSVEHRREEIIALVETGHGYAEIAQRLGLSYESVARACRRWGHPSRLATRPPDEKDLAPCGTAAAKLRHRRAARRAGVPFRAEELRCACRLPGADGRTKTGRIERRRKCRA